MSDDGRLLILLGLLGIAGATAARGSRGAVRRGRGVATNWTSGTWMRIGFVAGSGRKPELTNLYVLVADRALDRNQQSGVQDVVRDLVERDGKGRIRLKRKAGSDARLGAYQDEGKKEIDILYAVAIADEPMVVFHGVYSDPGLTGVSQVDLRDLDWAKAVQAAGLGFCVGDPDLTPIHHDAAKKGLPPVPPFSGFSPATSQVAIDDLRRGSPGVVRRGRPPPPPPVFSWERNRGELRLLEPFGTYEITRSPTHPGGWNVTLVHQWGERTPVRPAKARRPSDLVLFPTEKVARAAAEAHALTHRAALRQGSPGVIRKGRVVGSTDADALIEQLRQHYDAAGATEFDGELLVGTDRIRVWGVGSDDESFEEIYEMILDAHRYATLAHDPNTPPRSMLWFPEIEQGLREIPSGKGSPGVVRKARPAPTTTKTISVGYSVTTDDSLEVGDTADVGLLSPDWDFRSSRDPRKDQTWRQTPDWSFSPDDAPYLSYGEDKDRDTATVRAVAQWILAQVGKEWPSTQFDPIPLDESGRRGREAILGKLVDGLLAKTEMIQILGMDGVGRYLQSTRQGAIDGSPVNSVDLDVQLGEGWRRIDVLRLLDLVLTHHDAKAALTR